MNRSGDVNLYHIGNNQAHRSIYERALREPGVAVLHDAVLNHFFLGSLGEREYIEEFVYNYGEWSRGLAGELWRARAGSGAAARFFEFPMLRRITEASRAVVVHNEAAAALVRRHAPAARTVVIPHLWQPTPLPGHAETVRLRQTLGIPVGAFVFGVFGFLRESKRLDSILRAFHVIESERARLVVAGRFVSSDLERALAPLLEAPGVLRLPYLPGDNFWRVVAMVDACINLRYPGAGETSGISLRLMGAAKPVIVTNAPETAAFPEHACVRIDSGPAECDMLAHYMMWFTAHPEAAAEIGRLGAGHARSVHDLQRVAGLYWTTLCAHSG